MANLCLVLDSSLQGWERDYFHALGSRLEAEVHFPSEKPGYSRLNPRNQMWFVSRWWREWAHYYARPGVFFTPLGPYTGNTNFVHHIRRKLIRGEPTAHVVTHCQISRRFFLEVEKRDETLVSHVELPYIAAGSCISNSRAHVSGSMRVGVLCDFDSESNFNAIASVAHFVRRRNGNIHFHLRGNGPLALHFVAQVRDLGLQQTLVFENSSAPFPCDVLLHVPLRSEHLIPVFQAGSAGVPIITYELPGIEKIVRDKQTGFFTSVHDTAAAGNILLQLANDVGLRQSMGQRLQAACSVLQSTTEFEQGLLAFFKAPASTSTPRAA